MEIEKILQPEAEALPVENDCSALGIVGDVDVSRTEFVGLGVSGGMVICTELWRQELISDNDYKADRVFSKILAREDPYALMGYFYWAIPLVKMMRKSYSLTYVVSILIKPFLSEVKIRVGVPVKSNPVNAILFKGLLSICRKIGKRQRDRRLRSFYEKLAMC